MLVRNKRICSSRKVSIPTATAVTIDSTLYVLIPTKLQNLIMLRGPGSVEGGKHYLTKKCSLHAVESEWQGTGSHKDTFECKPSGHEYIHHITVSTIIIILDEGLAGYELL